MQNDVFKYGYEENNVYLDKCPFWFFSSFDVLNILYSRIFRSHHKTPCIVRIVIVSITAVSLNWLLYNTAVKLLSNVCLSIALGSSRPLKFKVNATKKYQTLLGFGGAFTDSAGINIQSLGKKAQKHLMR